MGTRKSAKSGGKKSKRLSVSKKTLRDLSPRKSEAVAVRGGQATVRRCL
jgi:hypothetical protein